MSVLIRGMEMPKNCGGCPLRASCVHRIYLEYRPDYCPLIRIPPHGRLIDANEIIIPFFENIDDENWMRKVIKAMPTIIPADGGEQMTDPLVAIGDGLYDAFEWGYAQGKKDATKWISVNERLPEDGQRVLAFKTLHTKPPVPWHLILPYSTNLESVSEYEFLNEKHGGFYDYDDGYYELTDITHWMPLPEPPNCGEEMESE